MPPPHLPLTGGLLSPLLGKEGYGEVSSKATIF